MAAAGATKHPGSKSPRLSRAVVDLGGDILRDTLYFYIIPAVIKSHVLASKHFTKNPLNTHQNTVLGNASVIGNYSECDITLLYTLLRNLTPCCNSLRPSAGWGRPVSAGDISLGDDIERIRCIRNEMYGHIASTYMSDSEYNNYMKILQDICSRMDTTHFGLLSSPSPRTQTFSQMLNNIQIACMDPEMENKYIDDMKRMRETDKETRDLIGDVKKDMSGY